MILALHHQKTLPFIEEILDNGVISIEQPGKPLKPIKKHPNFRLIATQNPNKTSSSHKRMALSTKFLSRFQIINFPETAHELTENEQKSLLYDFAGLFIKNFPKKFDKNDLKYLFSKCGKTVSCEILRDDKGNSKQIAFVIMATKDQAYKAVKKLNGSQIDECKIYCHEAHISTKEKVELSRKIKGNFIYFNNVDSNTTEKDVFHVFCQFGHIESFLIESDSSRFSKQSGFVLFSTEQNVIDCIKNSVFILFNDKQLYVSSSTTKDEKLKKDLENKIMSEYPKKKELLERCHDLSDV